MALTNMLDWAFPQTIETIVSPINGQVRIVKFQGKYNLWAGGAEQSGELVEKLWRDGLLKGIISSQQQSIHKILILGLGAGSIVKVLHNIFPNLEKIVGVEIDPIIIDLGKKYFGLGNIPELRIVMSDANEYVTSLKEKFDLIVLDCYKGKNWDPNISSLKFVDSCQSKLNKGGLLVMNLLDFYFPKETRTLAFEIEKKYKILRVKQEYNILLFISHW